MEFPPGAVSRGSGAPAMMTIAGLDSPDDVGAAGVRAGRGTGASRAADALALTFAQQVAPVKKRGRWCRSAAISIAAAATDGWQDERREPRWRWRSRGPWRHRLSTAGARHPGRATRSRTGPAAGRGGAPGPAMVTIAGLDPPGDAAALALTFAQQVAPVKKPGPLVPIGGDYYSGGGGGWMAG